MGTYKLNIKKTALVMNEVPPFYLPVLNYQNRLVTNPVYQLIIVSQVKNPFF